MRSVFHKTIWLLSTCATGAFAEPAPKVEFGAFLDTYYAYDINQPANRERLYTTNPTRHQEFNVNLAHVEAKISGDRLRGRLALQAGTSVYSNYSTELRDAAKAGGAQLADLMMHVQEGYAGYRLAEGLWIDAGIYFSHIGAEGFISRDNWNYTRSLVADFSPYYQSGVKLTWDPNKTWTFQLQVLNGWQNILETNTDKSLGTQVSFHPNEKLTITYNSLIGKETEMRIFQDLVVKYQVLPFWETMLALDLGYQKRAADGSFASWWGTSLLNRVRLDEKTHLGLRLEYYRDPEGVIVPTGTANGFRVWGASANIDVQLLPQLLWRNEVRTLHSRDSIYPANSTTKPSTSFFISSFALSL